MPVPAIQRPAKWFCSNSDIRRLTFGRRTGGARQQL